MTSCRISPLSICFQTDSEVSAPCPSQFSHPPSVVGHPSGSVHCHHSVDRRAISSFFPRTCPGCTRFAPAARPPGSAAIVCRIKTFTLEDDAAAGSNEPSHPGTTSRTYLDRLLQHPLETLKMEPASVTSILIRGHCFAPPSLLPRSIQRSFGVQNGLDRCAPIFPDISTPR